MNKSTILISFFYFVLLSNSFSETVYPTTTGGALEGAGANAAAAAASGTVTAVVTGAAVTAAIVAGAIASNKNTTAPGMSTSTVSTK